MDRRSQTVLLPTSNESAVLGGRAMRSTTRAGGRVPPPPPAAPITLSRKVDQLPSTGLQKPTASVMESPNSYAILGADEDSDDPTDTTPPPGSPDPGATPHGWDSFVNSLDESAKRE
jgi:hypothetical protein